jgi:predicted nucleic acid-binding protein
MIYAACQEAGVTRLYSEDLPGAAIQGLSIVNPFAG